MECMVDRAFMDALAAADRITNPVERSDIMRDAGAVGDAATRTRKLPHWPDPLPLTTALRLLVVQRPDLIRTPV